MPSGSGGAGSSSGASPPSGGGGPDEWSAIRSLFANYDTQLNDLRKTGLGVITALLSATAISSLFNLPNYEAFVLILLTYVLIVIMQYLDQHYRTFRKAAMARATVIEPMLNVELSQKIAAIYKKEHGYLINPALYIALIFIACALGCAIISSSPPANNATNISPCNSTILSTNNSVIVLSDNCTILSTAVSGGITPAASSSSAPINMALASHGDLYILILIGGAIAAIGLMIFISKVIHPDLKRESTGLQDDWIVDKVTCVKGDVVKITVTNLGDDVIEKDDKVNVVKPGGDITIPDLGRITVIKNSNGETVTNLGEKVTVTEKDEMVTITYLSEKVTVTEKGKKVTIPSMGQVTVTKKSKDETVIYIGEKVKVTYLAGEVTVTEKGSTGGIFFKENETLCDILDENDKKVDTITVKKEVRIPKYDNHSWLWETAPACIRANAIYKIIPKDWTYPLAQITVLDKVSDDNRPKPERISDYESWTIDKASCEKGDPVTITVTNVSYPDDKKDLFFNNDQTVCDILNDSGTPLSVPIKAKAELTIQPGDSYSWVWNTDNIQENMIYRIRPGNPIIKAENSTTPSTTPRNPLKQSVTVLRRDTRSILKGT